MSNSAPSNTQQMPIWRDASRLLVAVEDAVRHFPRYHKYTLCHEMRQQAMQVCRLISRASRSVEQRASYVGQLAEAMDDLKLQIQLAKRLRVFRHFAEFEALATLAVAVGKQCGGWKRHMQATAGARTDA
ncbi:MAG: four helix bundle protein [Gammaproteobacteria bacterium]|nr:four helix bundle protein [Gammaproteobacteria bacterium]